MNTIHGAQQILSRFLMNAIRRNLTYVVETRESGRDRGLFASGSSCSTSHERVGEQGVKRHINF